MESSGALGNLINAITVRWRAISDRCNDPDHNCALPCDLESLIQAIGSHPPALGRRDSSRPRREVGLRRLLDEFALFRSVVLEEASHHLSRALALNESVRLNGAIDLLAADAVEQEVSGHYRGIEQAVDGQNTFLQRLSHDVRGQLNAVLLTIQLLERQLAGNNDRVDSVKEFAQLRRTILATIQQIDHPASAPPALQNR